MLKNINSIMMFWLEEKKKYHKLLSLSVTKCVSYNVILFLQKNFLHFHQSKLCIYVFKFR